MNDTSHEERIKLKLDTEDEYDERVDTSEDKENISCRSNTSRRHGNKGENNTELIKYLESSRKIEVSINTSTSDLQFKHTPKNPLQNRAYQAENKNQNSEDTRSRELTNYSYVRAKEQSTPIHQKSSGHKSQFEDSMANTTEKDHRVEVRKEERVESRESMDDSEYKCQKCSQPFDNKSHLPLCLPSGHFFCKQCIVKMQMRKHSGSYRDNDGV